MVWYNDYSRDLMVRNHMDILILKLTILKLFVA